MTVGELKKILSIYNDEVIVAVIDNNKVIKEIEEHLTIQENEEQQLEAVLLLGIKQEEENE